MVERFNIGSVGGLQIGYGANQGGDKNGNAGKRNGKGSCARLVLWLEVVAFGGGDRFGFWFDIEEIIMVNIIKDGDLFTVPADILINPVNRMGISGAGLAKEFKRRFPEYEKEWRKYGFPMEEGRSCLVNGIFRGIVYLATKHKPSDKISDIVLIEKGLGNLRESFPDWDFTKKMKFTVNMPALGCGLGGLDFEGVIKPLILDMFQNEPYTINLFEPK